MTLFIKTTYISKIHYKRGFNLTLITILIMFLFSKVYWEGWLGADKILAANKFLVFQKHEYWRLLTSVFVHSDLKHFLSNSYMMLFLSYLNYSYFGPLLFPILSIVFAAIVNLISLYTYPDYIFLVGASGWVYLLGGTWLSLYILIDKNSSFFKRIFKGIAVGLIIFFPQSYLPEVSYRTHAIGFLVGIFTGLFYYIIKRKEILSFEQWEDDSEEEFSEIPASSNPVTQDEDSPTYH